MEEYLIDLSVGETIQIGGYAVTVLDTHEDGISVEVEDRGERSVIELKTGFKVLSEVF